MNIHKTRVRQIIKSPFLLFTSVLFFLSQCKLSFIDFFYSRAICQQIVCNMNQKYLHSPVSKTFGPEKGDLNKHMFNYSDITFKRMRCLFSEEGWLFSSLPTKVSEDQILGEFEPLLSHLNLHKTDVY